MLWSARQVTHRWCRRRRSHIGISLTPFTMLNFHSSPQTKFDHKESAEFLTWLERKSGTEISSVLSIGNSGHRRSLLASKNIRAGDCILKQLAPDSLVPELRDLLGDRVGDVAKVAVVVLYEQKMNKDYEWAPYIGRLPPSVRMHSTIFWSVDELEMIRPSSLYQETINQRSHVEKELLAIRTALEHYPEMSKSINCKDFMHAYALGIRPKIYASYSDLFSMLLQSLLEHGEAAKIPFADFLNHDGTSESVVLSDDDKHCSEVYADHNYGQGVDKIWKIFKCYPLMLDFEFTLPYNIHDQVQIQVNIPHQDIHRVLKLEMLKRHHRLIHSDVNAFNSSVDHFTIKKGIPQSLCAFAGVLCCTSCEELSDLVKEAAEHDGRLARRSLPNRSRETEAHRWLMEKLTQLAEDHEAHL